ncbi:MAG: hypothetical protein ACM3JB_12000 [Acidobacteriaceae bacterium]
MRALHKVAVNLRWLPAYLAQQRFSGSDLTVQRHLIIALADHFEPCYSGVPEVFNPVSEQVRRVREWASRYPATTDDFRDADGHPFKHTYFYPAEHNHPEVLSTLAEHCRQGWGEIEVHLHHGINQPDTSANTRETLESFLDTLAQLGALSRTNGGQNRQYAFVHGNWALANYGNGKYCGVDDEMQILSETGCYADFTMPAAPGPLQIAGKVNSIYECGRPLNQRAPHRRGRNLRAGQTPEKYPILVQGPLMLDFRADRLMPRIENAELSEKNPATLRRLNLWRRAGIIVQGRPEWCFIKLHCHGMAPSDFPAMLGAAKSDFLRQLTELSKQTGEFDLHFVSAREMINMILAACDGHSGNPGKFRDYKYRLISTSQQVEAE